MTTEALIVEQAFTALDVFLDAYAECPNEESMDIIIDNDLLTFGDLRTILTAWNTRTLSRPLPDRETRFVATIGIRRRKHVIESVAELLRLINGGAAIADIHLLTDDEAQP